MEHTSWLDSSILNHSCVTAKRAVTVGLHSWMEMLNSLVRDGAMLCAVHLSILADIPSGPLALMVSKDLMYARTSLVVQGRSSGQEVVCGLSLSIRM